MITETIKGFKLYFESNSNCFSPKYIDNGTLAMLSFVDFNISDKVLDLGCGYGVVGILTAKFSNPKNIFLADISKIAIQYAKRNAKLNNVERVNIIPNDAYKNLDETDFNLILSNSPITRTFLWQNHLSKKGLIDS